MARSWRSPRRNARRSMQHSWVVVVGAVQRGFVGGAAQHQLPPDALGDAISDFGS